MLAKSKARTHSACVSLTANRWFPHEDVKVKKKKVLKTQRVVGVKTVEREVQEPA